MTTMRYHRTAARPEAVLALPDGIDVTAGYTFSLKIGHHGDAALLTKTTNIIGGNGQVTVTWGVGELATLPPGGGIYELELTATTGGFPRVYTTTIRIDDVIT